jgi:hypothetical protein
MAKKNSLKIAPYVAYKISTYSYDESLSPDWNLYGTAEYTRQSEAYRATQVENVSFDGVTLMEYTYGRPGEQTTGGWNGRGGDRIEWRDNVPFEATLTIRNLERGRSAARFWFEDVDNQVRYPFFGQTLVDMLSESVMDHGKVTGTWIVVKKGSNYGIELYIP